MRRNLLRVFFALLIIAGICGAFWSGYFHPVLAEVMDALGKIPGPLWAVIGSLGGVWLSNRESARRLVAQFSNDRMLRVGEREYVLRREIYMAAAEALYAGVMAIGRLANLETPVSDVTKDFLEKSPALAKVQIIAKIETLKAVMTFATEIANVLVTISAKRIPLDGQKRRLAQFDEQIAAIGRERDRQADMAKMVAERAALQLGHTRASLKLIGEAVEAVMAIRRSVTPMVIAVRKELDLPIDSLSFEAVMGELIEMQRVHMAKFLVEVSAYVDPPMPSPAPSVPQPPPR